MKKSLIKQYNKLNKKFYQQISNDFSDSRQYYWMGWRKVINELERTKENKKELKVLDLACGNGRFANFLKENLKRDFFYCGLDNSSNLLKIAKENLKKDRVNGKLINFDLTANYLKNSTINFPFKDRFDLITAFGLSHHLPSEELRLEFLESLKKLVNMDGLIVVSNWQFASDERFVKNILDLEKINKNKELNLLDKLRLKKLIKNLEKNDYLLDWRRFQRGNKKNVYRYCHFIDEKEMKELCQKSKLKIIDSYFADGKSKELNQYFLLKKA